MKPIATQSGVHAVGMGARVEQRAHARAVAIARLEQALVRRRRALRVRRAAIVGGPLVALVAVVAVGAQWKPAPSIVAEPRWEAATVPSRDEARTRRPDAPVAVGGLADAPVAGPAPASAAEAPSPAEIAARVPVRSSADHGAHETARRPELAAQNDRFAQAMAAKQRGDVARAVALLETLVQTYPSGPLKQSALAEEMRLLAHAQPARAAEVAEAYVRLYPSGFARAEALRILGR
jgi:hypothetical protein